MKKTNNSRREFIKKTTVGTTGIILGFSAKSYSRIIGANDRVNVGLVGFSNRARITLVPSLMVHAKMKNFDIIGVSDLWNERRELGARYLNTQTVMWDIPSEVS